MLELICQQRYRVHGVPVDISQYANHGTAIDTTETSPVDPQHKAIHFPNADSRVAVGLGTLGAWSHLVTLKIEVDVRLDTRAARTLYLVEGDASFRFDVMEDAIEAFVAGAAGPMYVRSDQQYAPDGNMHKVPSNRWVTLGLWHDGFARMQLFIDGVLVGETIVNEGVPPVQAGGVSIGNTLSGGIPMLGDIEEVRIWRLDPNEARREFMCRKMDAKTAGCWEAIFQAARAWISSDPTHAASLIKLLEAQQRSLIHSLYMLPPNQQARARAILSDYAQLWCEGRINGPKMRKVLQQWFAILGAMGIEPASDSAAIKSLIEEIDLKKITLNCDPKAVAFVKMIAKSFETSAGRKVS